MCFGHGPTVGFVKDFTTVVSEVERVCQEA